MNRLKAALRVLLSGVLAWIFLTLFCVFYFSPPISAESESGATDYKWEPDTFYCHATEGVAWGKTNDDGYINAFDYDGASVEILLMGSSHTEGFCVRMERSISGELNSLLNRNAVYNIGVSGHSFLTCFENLEAALQEYRPKRVVIETSGLSFSARELADALEGSAEEITPRTAKYVGQALFLLQRNPYLRLLYAQIKNYQTQRHEQVAPTVADGRSPTVADERLLGELLQKLSETAQNGNADVIIFYHPPVRIAPDGAIQFPDNPDELRMFVEGCEKSGITFLDMRERFRAEYEKDYTLPYGFYNTPVGSGHLNRAGCEMVAEELYRVITTKEAES